VKVIVFHEFATRTFFFRARESSEDNRDLAVTAVMVELHNNFQI